MYSNARHSYPGGYAAPYRQDINLLSTPRVHPFQNRPPPRIEEVNSSNHTSNRKRISVACGRCRKRKIRCSGDPGDGTGCVNCKTAGVTKGQCQFLRVQCQQVQLTDMQPIQSTQSSAIFDNVNNLAAGYPAGACLTAPAAIMGRSFEAHIQNSLAYAGAPILHSSRSWNSLPTQNRRQAPGHRIPTAHDESNLALLASNAEVISNASATGSRKEQLAVSDAYPECVPNMPALDPLITAGNPPYALSQWHSPTDTEDGFRVSTDGNVRNSTMDSDDNAKDLTSAGIQGTYLNVSGYAQPHMRSRAYTMSILPTSSIRDGNLTSDGYAYIANGPPHLDALGQSSNERPYYASVPITPSSGSKEESYSVSSGDYPLGFDESFSAMMANHNYSEYPQLNTLNASPLEVFPTSNILEKSSLRKMGSPNAPQAPEPHASKLANERTGSHCTTISSNSHSRRSSSAQYSDKSENIQVLKQQTPKMNIKSGFFRQQNSRPSSAGCTSPVTSPSRSLQRIGSDFKGCITNFPRRMVN